MYYSQTSTTTATTTTATNTTNNKKKGNYKRSSSTSSSLSSSSTSNNSLINNNSKKKIKMKLSTDPQSVAARERRHRISDRFKILQSLVPGGSKMDTVSMLEEAIHYVKFLKAQIWLHNSYFIMINNTNTNPIPATTTTTTNNNNDIDNCFHVIDDHENDHTMFLTPHDHHGTTSTLHYQVPSPLPDDHLYSCFQDHEITTMSFDSNAYTKY